MASENKGLVLVVGGARGIGAQVSSLLAGKGYIVAIADKEEEVARDLAAKLANENSKVGSYRMDVTSKTEVEAVVSQIEQDYGTISHLVYSAGVLRMGNLHSISIDAWEESFAVNVSGLFYVVRALSSSFMKTGRGASVVTIASNAAKLPRMNMGAYAPSKAAAAMATKCLGLELAAYGVRCNIINPGSTKTQMLESMDGSDEFIDELLSGSLKQFKTGIPLQKLGEPNDIAELAVFYYQI
ncbi:SDR family NAD(P)-dependent oxidoreductase [Bacillus sp. JCM 19041]|uniref:SDR family NAD(P)-dependent oxidoreductase n=1 Tax=Bacillus sp. JCM 19041 TaxID=1460637 RepID=UPI0006D04F15